MFVVLLFVRVFLDVSSGRKSFRFPQVLIKILSSELNTYSYVPFHCIIIKHN